jgi:hypothetical protein
MSKPLAVNLECQLSADLALQAQKMKASIRAVIFCRHSVSSFLLRAPSGAASLTRTSPLGPKVSSVQILNRFLPDPLKTMDCIMASTALTINKRVKSSVRDGPCFVPYVSTGIVKGMSILIGADLERRAPLPWRSVIAMIEETRLHAKALRNGDANHVLSFRYTSLCSGVLVLWREPTAEGFDCSGA